MKGTGEVRERILQAAGEAFACRGYLGVSLGEVAMGLGLSRQTLTEFFPTKANLAQEIVDRQDEAWAALPFDCSEDPLTAVVSLTYRVAESYQADAITRGGTRLWAEATLSGVESHASVACLDRITGLLDEARSRREARPSMEPARMADVICTFLHGAQVMSQELAGGQDLAERLDRFWAIALPFLRGGLGG